MIEPIGRRLLDRPVKPGDDTKGCCHSVHVIARSECDEAIHVSTCGAMDCFASLAMTVERSEIEMVRYPCGITEIRAQSRRPISTQSWVLRRSAMLTASQMPMAVSATVNASAATLASIR